MMTSPEPDEKEIVGSTMDTEPTIDADTQERTNDNTGEDGKKVSNDDDEVLSFRLESIQLEVSDVCKLVRDRKSEARNCLLFEKFPEDNKNNYATFRTNRPLTWFAALQKYVHQSKLITRCELKKQKKIDKVSILKAHLSFQETKQVFLSLNFNTGVLSVKNKDFKTWVSDEFPLVSCHVNPITEEGINTQEVKETTVEELGKKGEEEEKNEKKDKKDDQKIDDQKKDEEVTNIWEAIDGLKNAMKSIEMGLVKLTERMDAQDDMLKDFVTVQDNKRKCLDKKLDDKICVFKETIEKSTEADLLKVKNELNNKVVFVKLSLGKLTNEIENKFNSFTPPAPHVDPNTHGRLLHLENRVGSVSKFEEDLNKLDEHYTAQFSEISDQINSKIKDAVEAQISLLPSRTTTEATAPIRHIPDCNSLAVNTTNAISDSSAENIDNGRQQPHEELERNRVIDKKAAEPRYDNETIIIMCMDSNSKHLDRRRLWDLDGTEFQRCGDLEEVNVHIDRNVKFSKLQYFFISVGVNDIDTKDGEEVFDEMKNTIVKLKNKHPNIKVIISEITPRMDERDSEVIIANSLLNEFVKESNDLFITKNGNLRKKKFFVPGDCKHLRIECIARFAANIKYSLRAAYGRKKYDGSWHPQHQQQHHRQPTQPRGQQQQRTQLSPEEQKRQQQQWVDQVRMNGVSDAPALGGSWQGCTSEDILRSLSNLAKLLNPALGT